jgi:glucose/arabinose dehydrogenase
MEAPDIRKSAFGGSIGLPLLFACAGLLLPGCSERESATSKSAMPVSPAPANADAHPPNGAPVRSAANQPRDIAIIVRDVLAVPPSRKERPLTRINNLIHAGDGSGRMFVSDMTGRIYVIKDEKLLAEPFLDMTVARRGAFMAGEEFEQGLNGCAFHPDFAKAGRPGFGKLYTASTEVPGSGKPDYPSPYPTAHVEHHNVLAEWSIDPRDPNRVDPASRREVLRIAHPRRDHVMSQLGFAPHAKPSDPDYGMLYIGVGDGGNTASQYKKVDAWHVAQNRLSPHGKILRINPLAVGDRRYSIPSDNPFARDASYLKEIWALGLRNPQRFNWDSGGDHRMLIADIGQAEIEEINIGQPGANYGWGEREGMFVVDPDDEHHLSPLPPGDERFGYTYPAVQYRHDLGKAVTGGFVYRGEVIPALYGKYVFGDIASGRIFFVEASTLVNGRPSPFGEIKLRYLGRERSLLEIVGEDRADLRFGMDDRGAIYLLTKRDGMIRKLSIPAVE